jgi:predicted transposase YbfD/YdcC
VPDPHKRKGRRQRWLTRVCLIVAAIASAQATLRVIARGEHRAELFALLRGLAIDGKAIRGVGRAGQPGQLVSLVPHSVATVLGQVEIARKRAARSAVPAVLADRDLTGTVITFDALTRRRTTARALRSQHGHDLLRVQKNQAARYAYVELRVRLPAHPATHEGWERVGRFSEQGHGRWDTRRLICGNAHIEAVDWLAVPQVVRRAWERIALKRGNRSTEVRYGLVRMPPAEAVAALSERVWRGHWTIEHQVDQVRDVPFAEDAGHAAHRTTAHPRAAMRTGLLTLLRQAHWRSLPEARAVWCCGRPCRCPHWHRS